MKSNRLQLISKSFSNVVYSRNKLIANEDSADNRRPNRLLSRTQTNANLEEMTAARKSLKAKTPQGTRRRHHKKQDLSDAMKDIMGARELMIRRGDNMSLVDASINKTCAFHDFGNLDSEEVFLLPYHSH